MRALVVLALCGCRGILGIHDPVLQADDVGPGDGPSGGDTPDGLPPGCYGVAGWLVCLGAPPTAPVTLQDALDTDTSPLCLAALPASWTMAGQPDVCMIAGSAVSADTALNVHGSRALVLVADTELQLASSAVLDIASHHNGGGVGPGANAQACTVGGNGGNSANGAGGAAGGSFTTPGGDGGDGTGAGHGGNTATVSVPDVLRGGCPGGKGGSGQGTAAVGGASGGAVYLVAGGSITISGFINASGAGGNGGTMRGGGGGGGAGGMIVMAAPSIDVLGNVIANGGGGGEGANDASAGGLGQDADFTLPTTPAGGGGGGSSSAGDGGDGAADVRAATNAFNAAGGSSSGGGGGGGSVGVIRVLSGQQLGGTVSPPPVP